MEILEANPDFRSQRINILHTHKRLEESASRQQDPSCSEEGMEKEASTMVYIAP
jgi:hypothetical protein